MMKTSPDRCIVAIGDGAAEFARDVVSQSGGGIRCHVVLQEANVASESDVAAMAAADAIVVAGPVDKMERSSLRRALVSARAAGLRTCLLHGLGGQAATAIRIYAIGAGFDSAASFNGRSSAKSRADALIKALDSGGDSRPSPLRLGVTGVDGPRVVLAESYSGRPARGDEIVLLPGARVGIVEDATAAEDGTIRLVMDRDIEASPGVVLADASPRPEVADQVAAQIVWHSPKPLIAGRSFDASLLGQRIGAHVTTIKHVVDHETLSQVAARMLTAGQTGACNLSFDHPIVFDPLDVSRAGGTIVIRDRDDGTIAGHAFVTFALRRATNIHWQALAVDKTARADLKGQRPCCLWFTGLSGSGKSTVASLLEKRLHAMGRHTYTLDGDNVRHGLNRDLGFTDADRVENIRRVAEVARLFVDAGDIVMVSFISPFRAERRMARELFKDGEFIEIFVNTPIEVCEQRDPKGLYKKARAGQLKNFTGIDSAYETPEHPEIDLDGGVKSPEALVEDVLRALSSRSRI